MMGKIKTNKKTTFAFPGTDMVYKQESSCGKEREKDMKKY